MGLDLPSGLISSDFRTKSPCSVNRTFLDPINPYLVKGTYHEAPRYAIFSCLQLLPLS
jgi:hypothetical protein